MSAGRVARRRGALAGAVVALCAAAVTGGVLAQAGGSDGCADWTAALAAKQQRDEGLVGVETARQFRLEAERAGWWDEAGQVHRRPAGCSAPSVSPPPVSPPPAAR